MSENSLRDAASLTATDKDYELAMRRIRAEFAEMPGMRLTAAQVQRLAGIEIKMCRMVLTDLVRENVLWVSSADIYAPATEHTGTPRQPRRTA